MSKKFYITLTIVLLVYIVYQNNLIYNYDKLLYDQGNLIEGLLNLCGYVYSQSRI
jgi:hypothetical protein